MTAIIFDIGGVLVHDIWEPLCFGPGGIAETYGLPMEQFRDFATKINIEYAKTPLATGDAWQNAEHTCWSRVISEFSAYFPDSIIPEDLALMTDDFIHPLNQDDIVEIIRALKEKGMKVGVCSDMSSFLYARITQKLHLEELFSPEHIIVSYNIGVLKMDGFQMFEAVTHAIGEVAENCTFFDDRPVNIAKAQEFGIEAVLVPASSMETSVVIKGTLTQKGLL
jgi:FMN phosphatase YigB (HAD superfamily)